MLREMSLSVLLVVLLWSLVEVHSQTYVSFMGENLPNHAYVDLTLVGKDNSDPGNIVGCITDLSTCCRTMGIRRGNWYFPNGGEVPYSGADIYRTRGTQRVVLRRRNNAMEPSGIYRCDIPTVAVHDDNDLSVTETVYVGLYSPSGGAISISGGVSLTVDSGPSPQFTLTCISTGGPATTVTWTRDSVTVTEGTETVLDDPVTAQYNHTLTVTGRLPGLYTCTVANDKPSSNIAHYYLLGIMLSVISPSHTSLTVLWMLTPDIPTLYSITYSPADTTCFPDSIPIVIAGIARTILYTLTNLEVGTAYHITVNATLTDGRPGLGAKSTITASTTAKVPSAPPTSPSASITNSTAITVQWGPVDCMHHNGNITGYSVQYWEVGSERTLTVNVSGGDVTEYTISGLIPSTAYSVQVAAVNSAGTGPYTTPHIIETPYNNVYLNLSGSIIPNHGYVVISGIGTTGDDTALLCHTNRPPPTGSISSGGDWFGRDGTKVPNIGNAVPGFRRNRGPMVVRLYRDTATGSPAEGIYYCQIRDSTDTLQALHVGLYNSGGGAITISSSVILTVDSDLNGASPQFTLTCISTGGPATTVTWTRDSVTVTEGTETVLDDPVTAQYTHTLTVTGRLPGLYTCTVANDKPSSDNAHLNGFEMFNTVPGQRKVELFWSNLSADINYTLSCAVSLSSSFLSLPISHTQSSLEIEDFSPNTMYSCAIVANSTFSPALTSFTTLEDYSFFQLHIHLREVGYCTNLEETDKMVEDITSAVLLKLMELCSVCGVTDDIINMTSLDCGSESVIVYRARLEGTSQTDSGSLISLIEDWVNTAPRVLVRDVLMKVDSGCSVAISYLNEESECSNVTTQPPVAITSSSSSSVTTSLSTVTGVAAAILIIIIVLVSIIVLLNVRGSRIRNTVTVSSRRTEYDESATPTTGDTDAKKMTNLKEGPDEDLIGEQAMYDDVTGDRLAGDVYEPYDESSLVDDGMYEASSYPDVSRKDYVNIAMPAQAEEGLYYDIVRDQ